MSLRLNQLLQFTLDGFHYAVELPRVERVARMVEYAPLPEAPDIVLGVIRWQGRVVPLLNLRKRFRLEDRPPSWTDHLIIARTKVRPVSLAVDAVIGVLDCRIEEMNSPEKIVPGTKYVSGMLETGGNLVLIHDLDQFLALDEQARLDSAINPN